MTIPNYCCVCSTRLDNKYNKICEKLECRKAVNCFSDELVPHIQCRFNVTVVDKPGNKPRVHRFVDIDKARRFFYDIMPHVDSVRADFDISAYKPHKIAKQFIFPYGLVHHYRTEWAEPRTEPVDEDEEGWALYGCIDGEGAKEEWDVDKNNQIPNWTLGRCRSFLERSSYYRKVGVRPRRIRDGLFDPMPPMFADPMDQLDTGSCVSGHL